MTVGSVAFAPQSPPSPAVAGEGQGGGSPGWGLLQGRSRAPASEDAKATAARSDSASHADSWPRRRVATASRSAPRRARTCDALVNTLLGVSRAELVRSRPSTVRHRRKTTTS